MKFAFSFSFLVAFVSCQLIDSRIAGPVETISTSLYDLDLGKPVSENDIDSDLGKRLTPYETYARDNPENQIPDYVTADCVPGTQIPPVIYTRDEIFQAMTAGHNTYLRYANRIDQTSDPRPSVGINRYPHRFWAGEYNLRNVNAGVGDRERMWIFPIRHPIGNRPPIWGGGMPGHDRVVFDESGRYLGMVTHRGEQRNQFHWASPTNARSQALTGDALRGFPGVPVNTVYNGPVADNRVLVNLVDAPLPRIGAWNVGPDRSGGGL